MSDDLLKIQSLVKIYNSKGGPVKAVSDLSLTVKKGGFFGLLGPNGAGKSTTINCITGITQPTSGTISVAGIDVVKDYKTARRKIGLSPQEFNVNIFNTAEQIIDYMGGYYGLRKSERQERMEQLLARFDLLPHRKKPFQKLSGGLKRRVILARALIHDPELLILDEPTAGVDVEQRLDLWGYLKELNQQGKTIIFTSHYLEEVEKLCDEIAVINHGRLVVEGSKQDFIKDGSKLEDYYLKIISDSNNKNNNQN